ncbi:GNAT family N-acetyltransferase [Nocardioides sp. R-C-SC26]|uniref:GNAT family N-acetyltransferase n=1 Tax=Nocardioides sp. R-C-SC26 TaxID=2870414 RepID=UPI001E4A7E18|nr:GNAT family N-acetyltransferase [Nocardioides sp. R-C-SC26]
MTIVVGAPGVAPAADRPRAAVRTELAQQSLWHHGGLAVLPGFCGQGVAGALVRARLEWARARGLLACASVWDDAPALLSLALRHGHVVGRHPVDPLTLVVYDA